MPAIDAPFVRRLKEAGGVMLGKTTTPEFGWKALGDSPLTGITRNPWNPAMTTGGSAPAPARPPRQGSGRFIRARTAPARIRIPSAFCGIYGLKPSYGRVPMWPASNTDSASHTGPMTRTVADAALMLSVMAGPDDWDRTSLDGRRPPTTSGKLDDGIKGLRVAWSPDLGGLTRGSRGGRRGEAGGAAFQALGCAVEEVKTGFADTRRDHPLHVERARGRQLRSVPRRVARPDGPGARRLDRGRPAL